jgi:hypothetical protein
MQASTGQGAGTREGALMHAEVESLEALVVVCGWGPKSHQSALEAIAAVDESSRGIPMRQVTIHLPTIPRPFGCVEPALHSSRGFRVHTGPPFFTL